MALLTRAAARRQALSNNGGPVSAYGATVSTTVRVDAETNIRKDRTQDMAKEGGPAVFMNAIGGVDEQCVAAKVEGTEAGEASQNDIHRESKAKRTQQVAKTRRATGPSRKKGNRTGTRRGAARAPLVNGGSDAEASGTQVATESRKRAREETTDPTVGKDSSGNARRYVRRKVAEAPPAARTLRNATNSVPRVPSSKEVPSEQEEQEEANSSDGEDDDTAPRFTRIQKGKFTETEGVALSALIELSLTERVFCYGRAAQLATQGTAALPPRTAPRRSSRLLKMRT